MHLLWRTLLTLFRSRRGERLHFHDLARLPLRVKAADLDLFGHVNNGVYFSLMDLGRMDLLQRSGVWSRMRAAGIAPVVASETITFRRSLQPRQKYVLETQVLGYDDRSVFVEQRFTVDGEIYARGWIRGRFVRPGQGPVSLAELESVVGESLGGRELPDWLLRWSADVALPSTRNPAPSVWE